MSDQIDRRQFVGAATMSIVAARLGVIGLPARPSGVAPLTGGSSATPGTHTSFGAIKQINAGLLNIGYAGSRARRRAVRHPVLRVALRHTQFRQRRATVGGPGLSGDRPVAARLRHDPLPQATIPECSAVRRGPGYHRV